MDRAIPTQRDPRLDVLRGFALVTIFVDHVPGNALGLLTFRNFGFADAAELFVVLASVSSTFAYGRYFDRCGIGSGLRRVGARCLRLYAHQAGLLVLALVTVKAWGAYDGPQRPELVRLAVDGGQNQRQDGPHWMEERAPRKGRTVQLTNRPNIVHTWPRLVPSRL